MFNFKVMNRALNDSNLSDKAFRMLYTIINYCSLKNSNSVEVHNAHLMMVLNISERWVRKITNELVEKGYITKKVNGTSQNKLANTYTLIDVEVNDAPTNSLCNDINKGDKNVPLTDRGNKSDAQKFPLTDDANIDGSSDGRIGILKNNIKINKKYNIHVNIHDNINTGNNIPEVINKNKFIKHDVNNINTGNSDDQTKDLRIEENINLNNENEMNEERVNEMNNIINSNETDINTPTLEEILETQALDDNQAFNTFSSFKNKETNYSKPEQERYQRLFNKCKSQIEIWSKTHDYSCISMFDAYFTAIKDMKDNNLISVKQWNAAQRYLFQRFMNLRNGYNKYLQNKNKIISSNEVNGCNSPRPPRRQNDQIEEVV